MEASPNDKFWGIGFDNENVLNNKYGWGKALMRVRDQLRSDRDN